MSLHRASTIKNYFQKYLTIYSLVWSQVWRYRKYLLAIVVLGIVSAGIELVGIALILPLLGAMLPETSSLQAIPFLGSLVEIFDAWPVVTRLQVIAGFLAVVSLVKGGIGFLSGYISSKFQVVIEYSLRKETYQQILAMDYQEITRRSSGYFLSLLNSYTRSLGMGCFHFMTGVTNAFLLMIYVVLLLSLSWKLMISAVVIMSIVAFGIRRPLDQKLKEVGAKVNKSAIRLNEIGIETMGGIRIIKGLARDEHQVRVYSDALDKFANISLYQRRLLAIVSPLFNTSIMLIVALFLSVGSLFLGDDSAAHIPLLLTFLYVLNRLTGPVNAFLKVHTSLMHFHHAITEICDFLRRDYKSFMSSGTREFCKLEMDINFKGITFHYEGGDGPSLDKLEFSIPVGKMTAIVGPSGAGKSTLTSLLLRLYDPGIGKVEINGEDLRSYQLGQWRSRIGLVSQDTFLFNDTLRNNLLFVKGDASDEEIWTALVQADAAGFVGSLPDGLDTIVGERGVRFSGGQQQRISIARALLSGPEILIMDEATSHLDSASEKNIQKAIQCLRSKCTLIVIAHRLATIQDADKIVVLKEGRVVEEGVHSNLMEADGEYALLNKLQASSAAIDRISA